jgi:hypothetical protein
MAARKPAARKPVKKGLTADQKFNALCETLSSISHLFGGSTISVDPDEARTVHIHISDDRHTYVYEVDASGRVFAVEDGEMRPTMTEEPIALVLDRTSRNDAFKDVHDNVVDYADRYAASMRFF